VNPVTSNADADVNEPEPITVYRGFAQNVLRSLALRIEPSVYVLVAIVSPSN